MQHANCVHACANLLLALHAKGALRLLSLTLANSLLSATDKTVWGAAHQPGDDAADCSEEGAAPASSKAGAPVPADQVDDWEHSACNGAQCDTAVN